MEEDKTLPDNFKAGYVAVMGRPNVGKSTLINSLLGQKIAAVSPRPQTTRKRQLGILTLDQAQVVFVDTPGVHKPLHKLGQNMNKEAEETLEESDLALFLVDLSQPPHPEDLLLVKLLNDQKRRPPVILALNKADLVSPELLTEKTAAYQALLPEALPICISAARGDNLDSLLAAILAHLQTGEPYYPADQLTDLYEREIAADLVREAALYLLRDEVPHGIAIRIDQYTERSETGAYIEATLFVEREAHKPIVIGQGGVMLKKIGSLAREKIEQMSGRKIYLLLRVKVRKNWRDDEKVLRWFGY
ncbi:MAG: GTPase Era [Anaerolineales bacterium]|jgi:GTP-binding protein Era|nr:GTPase Era [Anaerolineales bacterium]